MKQTLARTFIILSLILSLTSFILSLIAFYLPNWKYIQLSSTLIPIVSSDNNPMDPLIRGEVDKYTDILYHRGISIKSLFFQNIRISFSFIFRSNSFIWFINSLYCWNSMWTKFFTII